jgi:hypothetical protein
MTLRRLTIFFFLAGFVSSSLKSDSAFLMYFWGVAEELDRLRFFSGVRSSVDSALMPFLVSSTSDLASIFVAFPPEFSAAINSS